MKSICIVRISKDLLPCLSACLRRALLFDEGPHWIYLRSTDASDLCCHLLSLQVFAGNGFLLVESALAFLLFFPPLYPQIDSEDE